MNTKFRSKLIEKMKSGPYALSTDGSNDEGLVKMNPLLVRVFDDDKEKVSSQLLDMCVTKESTSEVLFKNIDDTITNVGIIVLVWDWTIRL